MGYCRAHWKVNYIMIILKHIIYKTSGPHHGHYVAIVKSNGQWMLFDDDVVTVSML